MKNLTTLSIITLGITGIIVILLIMNLQFRVLQLEAISKMQLKINENALTQLQILTKDRDRQIEISEHIVNALEKNFK